MKQHSLVDGRDVEQAAHVFRAPAVDVAEADDDPLGRREGGDRIADLLHGLGVVVRITSDEQYGVMMTKGSPYLTKINDALTAMKKDGTLQAFHKKWFGTDAPADSSTAKEEPLPNG